MAYFNGLNTNPKVIAELGPGDSLGIGLAALISGGEKFLALDVIKHAKLERNLEVFDELITLFKQRSPIPDEKEFPNIHPILQNHSFPSNILDEKRLENALEKERLEKIRNSILDSQNKDSPIQYIVPWHDVGNLTKESVDIILSQAVLEHIEDLPKTYQAMSLWLKPKGYISHQIDFKCHGTADEWNGHWCYSDFTWKLMKEKKPYLLNREPLSIHILLMKKNGFEVVCEKRIRSKSNLKKFLLAPRFKCMSDVDLTTSGVFIQAVKTKE